MFSKFFCVQYLPIDKIFSVLVPPPWAGGRHLCAHVEQLCLLPHKGGREYVFNFYYLGLQAGKGLEKCCGAVVRDAHHLVVAVPHGQLLGCIHVHGAVVGVNPAQLFPGPHLVQHHVVRLQEAYGQVILAQVVERGQMRVDTVGHILKHTRIHLPLLRR